MPDKIVDALTRTPAVLEQYEQLQSEAQQFVGQKCPAPFAQKIRAFSSSLEKQFGKKVSGRQLALARLRAAAANRRAALSAEDGAEKVPEPRVSL